MEWKCKLCTALFQSRVGLLRHCRLQHSIFSRVSTLPCLYDDCICSFQSFDALKAHLSRVHSSAERLDRENHAGIYTCHICNFKHPFSPAVLFGHLRAHLRKHELVTCPFRNCRYCTNVYSSFNAHKSRAHGDSSDFKDGVVSEQTDSTLAASAADGNDEGPGQVEGTDSDQTEVESESDMDTLRTQLLHNLASLFLKMQTILHVSDSATQEIIEHLSQIFSLSQPIIKKTIQEVLLSHDTVVSEACLDELVNAVMGCNIFTSATAKGEELATTKRRKTYIERHYPVVKPVEYVLEPGHTTVHISILETIQEMFKHTDILDKIKETKPAQDGQYMSHQDGSYFKHNTLLCSEELTIPVLLYMDDLEIANPLGTSRKIHKLTAVYWAFADLPSKYRSSLHVIQLAALCKVHDVEKFGYEKTLGPLLGELCTLERDGVFIESIGQVVKGTVMCVWCQTTLLPILLLAL